MLGLGNSITGGSSSESVLDLSSKVFHVSGFNVTSSDVGGEQKVSAMENLADGSSITVGQSVDDKKPIHDVAGKGVHFPFTSASGQVDQLDLSSAITLTDAFTVFFVSKQSTPDTNNDAYQFVTGSYTDANNKSSIYLFTQEDDGSDPYFNIRATQSGTTDEIGIEQFDNGAASTAKTFICITKDAGVSATVKVYQSSSLGFYTDISDTDFDANVDFVIDQIGGFEPFQNPGGGTGVPQGNMHLYELGVYNIALTEVQVREISNSMIIKHGIE
jgi:hypothetical protein